MTKKVLFSMLLALGIVSFCFRWNVLFRNADANLENALPQSKGQAQKQEDNESVEKKLWQDETDFINNLGPAKSTTGIIGSIGFVISDIAPGSPAEIVGLKIGDVILNVEQQAVSSVKPIMKMTRKDPGTPVTMIVWRYHPETSKIEHFEATMPLAALQ